MKTRRSSNSFHQYQPDSVADATAAGTEHMSCLDHACTWMRSGSKHPEVSQTMDLRHQALINAEHQRYDDALQILTYLIDQASNPAEDYSNRGLVYFRSGQMTKALADYNQALSLNPKLDRAYNNRANYFAQQGKWQAAIADYERALDLNPYNVRARINQGITYRDLGDYAAALDCFDSALLFGKFQGRIYAERGRAYHLRGDWNCAIADYRRALIYLPESQTLNLETADQLRQQVLNWLDDLQSLN